MSDAFTPQVRTLLDGLEPPALSADFADRVLAQVEAAPVLPPLPMLRQPRWRGGRRVALAVGIAGLVSVAAAAAVVPGEVWRQLPVIGGIVEMIAPAQHDPTPASVQSDEVPAVQAVSDAAVPAVPPPAEFAGPPPPAPENVAPTVQARADEPSPQAEAGPPAAQPATIERLREAPPQPMRVVPVAERPMPVETRPATSTVVATPAERVPERVSPADTRETRQQTRERATETRQATRERLERRERRANRTN